MTVKNRLREIRHELMVDTQKEMAARLGVSEKQYHRYENQLIQPSLDVALKIAKTLGRHVDDIFFTE